MNKIVLTKIDGMKNETKRQQPLVEKRQLLSDELIIDFTYNFIAIERNALTLKGTALALEVSQAMKRHQKTKWRLQAIEMRLYIPYS